jgi:hypothetical protein
MNRIDLVDEAIVDRFLSYEFAPSAALVLEEVMREKRSCSDLPKKIPTRAECDTRPGAVKSIREIERMVTRAYVDKLLKAP